MYVPNPGPVRYAGDPHKYPDVNANWEELIDGKSSLLTNFEKLITDFHQDDTFASPSKKLMRRLVRITRSTGIRNLAHMLLGRILDPFLSKHTLTKSFSKD